MIPERPIIERQLLAALDATPSRIPVLLGGCGSGRTSLLLRVAQILGEKGSQYLDVERAVSTPEGFCSSITSSSPYMLNPLTDDDGSTGLLARDARTAFDTLLRFFNEAQSPDARTPVFLIDELLEIGAFENFPGLRGVQRKLISTLSTSTNRFVLATRYTSRAHRLLRDAPERFEVIHIPALSQTEVSAVLLAHGIGRDDDGSNENELGRMVHVLTDGRPVYVQVIAETLASMDGASRGDPVSALAAQLSVGAHLSLVCRFSYELRLHRARGYGALKAILHVLAEEEPLTLTEIAHRLGRTAGSTKDYLTWLEDVDLVGVRRKRYSYADPIVRLWARLHCYSTPPDEADLSREVQEYAVSRLPYMESQSVVAETPRSTEKAAEDNVWSMIEID